MSTVPRRIDTSIAERADDIQRKVMESYDENLSMVASSDIAWYSYLVNEGLKYVKNKFLDKA